MLLKRKFSIKKKKGRKEHFSVQLCKLSFINAVHKLFAPVCFTSPKFWSDLLPVNSISFSKHDLFTGRRDQNESLEIMILF